MLRPHDPVCKMSAFKFIPSIQELEKTKKKLPSAQPKNLCKIRPPSSNELHLLRLSAGF